MKILVTGQHVGMIDAVEVLSRLGHDVTVRSYSFHSHLAGWPQLPVDWDTNIFLDDKACTKWCTDRALEAYDLIVVHYTPMLTLLMAGAGVPIIMWAPVRLGMDSPTFQPCVEKLVRLTDEGQVLLAADSAFDKACVEFHTGRPAKWIHPVCAYFPAKPDPNAPWGLDSRMPMPDMPDTTLVEKDWAAMRHKGIIEVPYQASTVSGHERLMAGFPHLCPSKELLLKLWGKKLSQTEVHFGIGSFDWKANIGLCDWFQYPNVAHWSNMSDLAKLLKDTPTMPVPDRGVGVEDWRSVVEDSRI